MAFARLRCALTVASSLLLAFAPPARAQASSIGAYSLNRSASAVGFTITASMLLKFKENGSFTDFTGNLSYDPMRPADAHIDLTVYTNSVTTRNPEHEQLLKSEDFFDVNHFPTMHFVSAATTALADGTFAMTGDMTIRGITRRLTIPVRLRQSAQAGSDAVFESNFQIDRMEFGLIGAANWGGLKVSIGKKVDVHIAIVTSGKWPRE
jgi:polyisoprenoid-binding protein YceI